jgi:hypothetical protein
MWGECNREACGVKQSLASFCDGVEMQTWDAMA